MRSGCSYLQGSVFLHPRFLPHLITALFRRPSCFLRMPVFQTSSVILLPLIFSRPTPNLWTPSAPWNTERTPRISDRTNCATALVLPEASLSHFASKSTFLCFLSGIVPAKRPHGNGQKHTSVSFLDKYTANVAFLCIVWHGSVIDCGGVAAFCALLPEALERGATYLNAAYGCSLGGACLTRLLAAMRMPIIERGELLCCHFCVRTQSVDFCVRYRNKIMTSA